MSIGKNIKRIREEKNITQYALAKMLGISQQAIDQWERSKTNPRKKTIDKIAVMLNVSISELFGDIEQIQNKTKDIKLNKKPAQLEKILAESEIMFDGELVKLTDEDKQTLKDAIELIYYRAKQRNKRKK